MEFKKPINYTSGRPHLTVPERGSWPPARATTAAPPRNNNHHGRQASRPWMSKKATIIILATTLCAGLGLFIWYRSVTTAVPGPQYQTVLPSDTSISQLGGWERVSPPQNDPVFAYADHITGVPISVSEQPLPASFQANTDAQVAELARKFNATNKLEAGATTIYVGTSIKGPQSVILAKNNLLILIKSERKVSDAEWTRYITSLQ